jgi:uncharacterized membrane protein
MQTESIPFHPTTSTTETGGAERWISLATATAVMAYGISRRSVYGFCLAAAAAPLAYRGFVGKWPRFPRGWTDGDTRSVLSGAGGIHVRESVRIARPVDEVFDLWRQLENLPRFMTHLESIINLGGGRSHWTARGPAGSRVEWDAEIINEVDNHVIGWRSLPGSDVVTAGSVNFSAVSAGECEVSVHLQYEPPAGRVGVTAAMILGREPSQMIREDLRHVKRLLEDPRSFQQGPI